VPKLLNKKLRRKSARRNCAISKLSVSRNDPRVVYVVVIPHVLMRQINLKPVMGKGFIMKTTAELPAIITIDLINEIKASGQITLAMTANTRYVRQLNRAKQERAGRFSDLEKAMFINTRDWVFRGDEMVDRSCTVYPCIEDKISIVFEGVTFVTMVDAI